MNSTPSNLENLIAAMLTENTGIALMDSGGENGRAWQLNAGKTVKTFRAEPSVSIERNSYSPFTVSTFHYLTSGVIELDETCDAFNALPCKNWDGEAYGISDEQTEWLTARGFTFGESWNTYNGENILDQILQGTNLKLDGCGEGEYFLMQVHGGADVRGGYTNAKLFKNSEFQGGINPCPDLAVEVDGISLDFYGGSDWVNVEGQSIDAPDLENAKEVKAYLANE